MQGSSQNDMSSQFNFQRRITTWLNRRSARRHLRLLLRIAAIVILVPLFLQILLAYYVHGDPRLLPPALRQAKNLLIVTAHPDDECLFFSPSILAVLENNPTMRGGLIVLSPGNNYGLGEIRKQELLGSCASLGIQPDRCLPLDKEGLQDNPKVWWEESKVQEVVKEYVKKWDIDVILTFDSYGISGHINHRAVSSGIVAYASTDSSAPPTYTLSSTALIRKYTILGDLPFTALPYTMRIIKAMLSSTRSSDARYEDKALVASSWGRYLRTRSAFAAHQSQYSWDRVIYMFVARHIWFNDLRRVERVV